MVDVGHREIGDPHDIEAPLSPQYDKEGNEVLIGSRCPMQVQMDPQ